jgi:hypothetical protein
MSENSKDATGNTQHFDESARRQFEQYCEFLNKLLADKNTNTADQLLRRYYNFWDDLQADDNAKKVDESAKRLHKRYFMFLDKLKLDVSAYAVDYYALMDIAQRYWRDVMRLHLFHREMGLISSHKIAGYHAYWICKLRPILVVNSDEYKNKPSIASYINEIFAICIAGGRIDSDDPNGGKDIKMDKDTFNTLLYSLRYRVLSGDALSLFFDTAVQNSNAPIVPKNRN